jgi:hypothetical protein
MKRRMVLHTTKTFHCVGIRDPNNSHDSCGVESTKSMDAMTTPGIRFTESVNATILLRSTESVNASFATRVLAFGPRDGICGRNEFWRTRPVHGIRVYNPGL